MGNNFDEIVLDESKDVLLEVIITLKRYESSLHISVMYQVCAFYHRYMLLGVATANRLSRFTTSLESI